MLNYCGVSQPGPVNGCNLQLLHSSGAFLVNLLIRACLVVFSHTEEALHLIQIAVYFLSMFLMYFVVYIEGGLSMSK